MRGGPGTPDAGQITFTNVTLISVILRAYNVKTYQVTGPDRLSSQRYDIVAKIPPGATKEQFNLMLQNLLAERFHLALHHQTKDVYGYELVTGKNGPKLTVSPDVQPNQSGRLCRNRQSLQKRIRTDFRSWTARGPASATSRDGLANAPDESGPNLITPFSSKSA